MIDNNHELTIGELDAVTGGESGLMGGGGPMGLINQIVRMVQKTLNPDPPTKSGPDPLQQAINSLGAQAG